jgi:hypothetical protein
MILLAGLLLFLAITLPNSFSAVLVEQQAVAESIADQVTALQALEQHIQEESSLADADRQELLAPIESALQELNTGELAREEAVAVLSQTEAELRELSESNDAESLTRALDAAGQSLAQNLATQALSQALADGDLAQASSALNQLADRLAGLSAGESSHLAQDLAQAAAALQGVNPALAGELAEATQALQSGEVEAAQQALREAAAAMQQRAVEQAAAALKLQLPKDNQRPAKVRGKVKAVKGGMAGKAAPRARALSPKKGKALVDRVRAVDTRKASMCPTMPI